MNAITVCYGYDDLLSITLPRNARHFDHILVVTHPDDARTKWVVDGVANANWYATTAFHRLGAPFDKGSAMEEGFSILGRRGWLCILDADTILPPVWDSPTEIGCLYSPWRRCLEDPRAFHDDLDWTELSEGWERRNGEFAGYCQIFHATDPALVHTRPWYTSWPKANGCDSDFMALWPPERRVRLDWHALHLGPMGTNWGGRVSPRIPDMERKS